MSGTEGEVTWDGHRTWYRLRGEPAPGGPAPLVLLHGGPGGTHDYLEPLLALGGLGPAGRALRPARQRPQRPSARRPHRVLDGGVVQARAVLPARGARHQAATCCSGSPGAACSRSSTPSTGPPGCVGMVVADSPASMPLWVEEANRLRTALPADVQAALTAHEQAGTTSSPEYLRAVDVFNRIYVCRLVPWPEPLERAFALQQAGSDGLRHDDRPERVPRHGHAQGLGHHRAPPRDRDADPAHLGPARRGHAAHRRGGSPRRGGRVVGAVRDARATRRTSRSPSASWPLASASSPSSSV